MNYLGYKIQEVVTCTVYSVFVKPVYQKWRLSEGGSVGASGGGGEAGGGGLSRSLGQDRGATHPGI